MLKHSLAGKRCGFDRVWWAFHYAERHDRDVARFAAHGHAIPSMRRPRLHRAAVRALAEWAARLEW